MSQKKMMAKLYAGEESGGMEMVQVAFSLAIAVMLGALVVFCATDTVVPNIEDMTAAADGVFDSMTNVLSSIKE